jgi:glycosyltransferase involved in cell wall biosynthesis
LRKIVFINQSTGYLTIDVINEFAKEFDGVALITGSIRIQNTKLNPKVKVSTIIKYNRGNNFKKAISWLLGTAQIFYLLKQRYGDYEKFFFTIPPTAYLLASFFTTSYSIAIYDLYPEALKVNGLSENNIICKWWSAKNRQLFSKAHRVYTISESLKSQVLAYSTKASVRVISNWSAFSGLRPIKKEQNRFVDKASPLRKFIVQYSGNIGMTHNLEILVEIADILKIYRDLEFVIISRGKKSIAIKDLIKKKGLTNCSLLPFRKDEDLYESLCSADLAIVTLDNKTQDISVPSKIYNIIAAGVPIMAIAPMSSGISQIIYQYQIGKTFGNENIHEMCEFVIELKNNPAIIKKLSMNSIKASHNFTNENAAKYLYLYSN